VIEPPRVARVVPCRFGCPHRFIFTNFMACYILGCLKSLLADSQKPVELSGASRFVRHAFTLKTRDFALSNAVLVTSSVLWPTGAVPIGPQGLKMVNPSRRTSNAGGPGAGKRGSGATQPRRRARANQIDAHPMCLTRVDRRMVPLDYVARDVAWIA
jgi:hypothetical protein